MNRRQFIQSTLLSAAAVSVTGTFSSAKETPGGAASAARNIPKIAIEEHWGNPMLGKISAAYARTAGIPESMEDGVLKAAIPRLGDFEKFRLPDMDKAGIAMQVIATGSPGIQGITDAAEAVRLAKNINDAQAQILARYPGRFAAFAALPLQDPAAAAGELERAVTTLGFRGAMVHGHSQGEYLDAKKFRPVWERFAALGVPLYLHIGHPLSDQIKVYAGYPELLSATWSWGVEAATHALRMIMGGVFDDFPEATLILGHMGEMLPYVLRRIDEGYAMAKKANPLKKKPSDYIRENVMITTSGWYSPATMRCAVDAMGSDRVLFATDYPFRALEEAVHLVEACDLSQEEKEKIYHKNARRLLGLKAQTPAARKDADRVVG